MVLWTTIVGVSGFDDQVTPSIVTNICSGQF